MYIGSISNDFFSHKISYFFDLAYLSITFCNKLMDTPENCISSEFSTWLSLRFFCRTFRNKDRLSVSVRLTCLKTISNNQTLESKSESNVCFRIKLRIGIRIVFLVFQTTPSRNRNRNRFWKKLRIGRFVRFFQLSAELRAMNPPELVFLLCFFLVLGLQAHESTYMRIVNKIYALVRAWIFAWIVEVFLSSNKTQVEFYFIFIWFL